MTDLSDFYRKKFLLKSLGAVLFLLGGLQAQMADFSAEYLTFTVNTNYVEMTGSYFFSNRTGKAISLPIVYPFRVNDRQTFPDSIHVGLPDRTEIVIYFRQPVSQPQFEYILTSTRSWQKPLESADFAIQVPLSQALTKLSFPYERIDTTGDIQVYRLHFENFYPEKNLIFSW
jgi:hypothetical protein